MQARVGNDALSAVGRFAPSTTGPAHPGTLLAALLCWLDARSQEGRVLLRLEDLDRARSNPDRVAAMEDDLAWLGLDWDERILQSEQSRQHEHALDRLEQLGVLYPCRCSRADLKAHGERAPDGGWRYPGTCRDRRLPSAGWRSVEGALRARQESTSDVGASFGDPIVRRRDGAVAYVLATVADDAHSGVTRVVRGRDLEAATATQVALQQQLGFATPHYRHHLLLLEESGGKLAKLHGSVGTPELRKVTDGRALTGWLAWAAGLQAEPDAVAPDELIAAFSWDRVGERDRLVRWTGRHLELAP